MLRDYDNRNLSATTIYDYRERHSLAHAALLIGMRNQWLKDRLKELGKKNRDLAQAIHEPDARITEMIKGDRQIHVEELATIAKILEWDVEHVLAKLAGRNHTQPPRVFVKGNVQAGVWMKAVHFDERDWEPVPFPIPEGFERLRPFVLKVEGDSVDEMFPHGTYILCVSTIDLATSDMEINPGDFVIAQRENDQQEFEITVKEYVRDDQGREWLMPRSSKPEFRGPIELLAGNTTQVKIIAVVIGSMKIGRGSSASSRSSSPDLPIRKLSSSGRA